MLDFNSRPKLSEKISLMIDQALQQKQAKQTPRDYLGGSRLGVECSRALQYEYFNTTKDEGRDFSGQLLRIFQAGHVFEELMIDWLKFAGFNLIENTADGKQFGFSALDGKIKGHIDGVIVDAPSHLELSFPMLWEAKSLNGKSWRNTVKKGVALSKPIYAGQIALYQAYLSEQIPGLHLNPALFTAINKDTAELYFELVEFDAELAQQCSDKGVRIMASCEAGELLPRITKDPSHFQCRMCAWQDRCCQTPT